MRRAATCVRRHQRDLFAAVISAPEAGEDATLQSYNSAVALLQVLFGRVTSARAELLWIDVQITKAFAQSIPVDAKHLRGF